MTPKPPSDRRLSVLRAMAASMREHGRPPTIRELCRALGVSGNNAIVTQLLGLEQLGLVSRPPPGTRCRARAASLAAGAQPAQG